LNVCRPGQRRAVTGLGGSLHLRAQPAVRRVGVVAQVPEHLHMHRVQGHGQFAQHQFVPIAGGAHEAFRQHGEQVRLLHHTPSREELVDGQHDAALPPQTRQRLVHIAVGAA